MRKYTYIKPLGLEHMNKRNHVFKLIKALYGFEQTPCSWYESLSTSLIKNGFSRGKIDTTFFHKVGKNNLLIVQIYVYDIIFGARNEKNVREISKFHAK